MCASNVYVYACTMYMYVQAWNFLWKITILKNKIIILFTSLKCHPLSRFVFFVVCSSLTVDQGRSFMAAPVTPGLSPLFSWPEGLLADRCGCRKELLNSNDEFEITICILTYLFEWEGEFWFPCLQYIEFTTYKSWLCKLPAWVNVQQV